MDIRSRITQTPQPIKRVEEVPEFRKVHSKKKSLGLVKILVITFVGIVLLAFGGFMTYKYMQANKQVAQLRKTSTQHSTTTNKSENTTQQLLDKVGKLVLLPTDETPTVALVKDISKLQNQPFFSRAQDGDYVIVYTQSKVAILYRPSVNRIIEDASTTD